MVFGGMFGEILELGMVVWVLDEFGHKHKVYVKNDAEKQKLLAKNAALRKKLAAKKVKPAKRKVAKKRAKRKSDWDL
jgi:hypothetical protein